MALGSPRSMTVLDGLLEGIVGDPLSEDRWLVLADWLEEYDDPRRGELLRLHRKMLATCCEPNAHPERTAWHVRMVELLGHGLRPCVPQKTVTVADGVEMTFSFIPPGSFLMGSPEDEFGFQADETLHRVTLTRAFWLGIQPVTQSQWQTVMGRNASRFKGEDLPVETVAWENCVELCDRLGESTSLRFRLPTEAEWEFACRAGTTTPFHFGETLSVHQATYNVGKTSRVKVFSPNAWGLFDMHGNVWEWCGDWYGDYSTEGVQDPQGADEGTTRVLRGGCWYERKTKCRSAFRHKFGPNGRIKDYGIGSRLVLCLDERDGYPAETRDYET
jgi:formylglycine-generating enzyme